MRQRLFGIVVACSPMLFHRTAGKFIVLAIALVVFGTINQLHDVVGLVISSLQQALHIRALRVADLIWQFLEDMIQSTTQTLFITELIRSITRSTGKTNVFQTYFLAN